MGFWKERLWKGYTSTQRRLSISGIAVAILAALLVNYALAVDNILLEIIGMILIGINAIACILIARTVKKSGRNRETDNWQTPVNN